MDLDEAKRINGSEETLWEWETCSRGFKGMAKGKQTHDRTKAKGMSVGRTRRITLNLENKED